MLAYNRGNIVKLPWNCFFVFLLSWESQLLLLMLLRVWQRELDARVCMGNSNFPHQQCIEGRAHMMLGQAIWKNGSASTWL